MPEVQYKLVVAVLVKMGVEGAATMDEARAIKKLQKRLTTSAVPEGLTAEETAMVESLKAAGPTATATVVHDNKGAAAPTADPNTPIMHRLKSSTGQADRLELITPTVAKDRNRRRGDQPDKWTPDPTATADQSTQNVAAKPGKAAATTEAKAAAKGAVANDKGAAKAAKASEKAATAAKAKTAAAATGAVAPAAEAKPKRAAGSGGIELFKSMFPKGASVPKQTVVDKLLKAGVKEGTAKSYIVWAKRPVSLGKLKNPFGFRITETKAEDGVKTLSRK